MTTYTARTIPTTNYNLTRIWGEYLVTSSWDYITDSNGNRIIVLVTGGHLPYTTYQVRDTVSTSYTARTPI